MCLLFKKLAYRTVRLDTHDDITKRISKRQGNDLIRLLLWRDRNRIRDDELLNAGIIDALYGRITEDCMGAGSVDSLCAKLLQCFCTFTK